MEACKYEETIKDLKENQKDLNKAILSINELTTELRTYNKVRHLTDIKRDTIIENLNKIQIEQSKTIENHETRIKLQEDLNKSQNDSIHDIEEKSKWDWQKWIASIIPEIIKIGIIALIVGILYSQLLYVPKLQEIEQRIQEVQK